LIDPPRAPYYHWVFLIPNDVEPSLKSIYDTRATQKQLTNNKFSRPKFKMVNTFLVDSNFDTSASLLDSRRLGKQRVEAYQILNILENLRILSGQSGIRCMGDFNTFVNEIKQWYAKQAFVYILCEDGLIEYEDKKNITLEPNQRVIKMGFSTHPAVEMWYGYEDALKEYIDAHINQWIKRGYKNTMKIYNVKAKKYPGWVYWEHFHDNHKGALLKKELDRNEKPWYQNMKLFTESSPFIDYIWIKNRIVYSSGSLL
jgi:hypothetical protein